MPNPQSPEVLRALELARVPQSIPLPLWEEALKDLSTLAEYECWDPYFRLANSLLSSPETRNLSLYTQIARSQNLYLEDVFSAADTCASAVKDLDLHYSRCREEMLPKVLGPEDYSAEATILSAIADLFTDQSDHVQALERLCLIYEKKLHNDRLLAKTYDKLLKVDAGNLKALRYFKLVYTQNNEWEEVARTLRTLLSNVSHPQELYRVAQELAAVLLYHLDQPREAVRVLDTFCVDSPLDTSMILYDAFESLGDYTGCLKILRQSLLGASDDATRGKVLFKIADIQEKQGEKSAALENYRKAFEVCPSLLDAAEGIVSIAIEEKNWILLENVLEKLQTHVQDKRLQAQLRQAVRRLKDGVRHASRT